MRNKKIIIAVALAAMAGVTARAERSAALSFGAHNAAIPATSTQNRVFSPFSYELDCCVFAEASDAVQRANIAETFGVLTDFESVYVPILESFRKYSTEDAPIFLTARALCVRDLSMANVGFRKSVWDLCNASLCSLYLPDGAETWIRAKMDGHMEDLELPVIDTKTPGHYGYFDVVYSSEALVCEKKEADVNLDFNGLDGTKRKVRYAAARCPVEFIRSPKYSLYRFPLKGGASLYVATNPENRDFTRMRDRFNFERFNETLASLHAIGDENCKKGMCRLVMPRLAFFSRNDLKGAMVANKIPAAGFANLDPSLVKREALQIVRFAMKYDEQKNAAAALVEADDEDDGANTVLTELGDVVIDSPFLFFVHHPDTDTITVSGEFVK